MVRFSDIPWCCKTLADFILTWICCLLNSYFSISKIQMWTALPFFMVKSTNLPLLSKRDVINHAQTVKGDWGHYFCPRHLRVKCLKADGVNLISVSHNWMHLLKNIAAISRCGGTRLWSFSTSHGFAVTRLCSPYLLYLGNLNFKKDGALFKLFSLKASRRHFSHFFWTLHLAVNKNFNRYSEYTLPLPLCQVQNINTRLG